MIENLSEIRGCAAIPLLANGLRLRVPKGNLQVHQEAFRSHSGNDEENLITGTDCPSEIHS